MRSCVDAKAGAMGKVEETRKKGNIAALLVVSVRGALDQASRNCFLWRME